MESNLDPFKKVSLGIFGVAPEAFHHAIPLTLRQLEFDPIPDFLLIAPNFEESSTSEILQKLESLEIYQSRVILLLAKNQAVIANSSNFGNFWICPEENIEETKTRLSFLLEQQRLKILNEFCQMHSSMKSTRFCDSVPLAFSLCMQLQLTIQETINVLQYTLDSPEEISLSTNLPNTISVISRALIKLVDDPNHAREELKALTAPYPFRLRTEIRAAVEKTFERLWKGNSNAA